MKTTELETSSRILHFCLFPVYTSADNTIRYIPRKSYVNYLEQVILKLEWSRLKLKEFEELKGNSYKKVIPVVKEASEILKC